MNFIDYCIETSALSALGWLVIEFIKYSWNRPRTAQTVSDAPVDEPAAVTAIDSIVPFKRPAKPQLSDAELIKLAKQHRYKGASKWSYNRKLNPTVRAELLKLAA